MPGPPSNEHRGKFFEYLLQKNLSDSKIGILEIISSTVNNYSALRLCNGMYLCMLLRDDT